MFDIAAFNNRQNIIKYLTQDVLRGETCRANTYIMKNNCRPIRLALQMGYLDLADWIITRYAVEFGPEFKNSYAIRAAAVRGHMSVVTILLRRQSARIAYWPSYYYVYVEGVRAAINGICKSTVITPSLKITYIEPLLQIYVERRELNTAAIRDAMANFLISSCKSGQIETLKYIIKKGFVQAAYTDIESAPTPVNKSPGKLPSKSAKPHGRGAKVDVLDETAANSILDNIVRYGTREMLGWAIMTYKLDAIVNGHQFRVSWMELAVAAENWDIVKWIINTEPLMVHRLRYYLPGPGSESQMPESMKIWLRDYHDIHISQQDPEVHEHESSEGPGRMPERIDGTDPPSDEE